MSYRTVALTVAVSGGYVLAARLGFQFAYVAEQITTVWAPTGIAIAALLLGGLRFAPAIWAGALIANLTADVPWWVAAVIASGNTAEALVASWLLQRATEFDITLRTIRSAVWFIGVSVAAANVGATTGVVTLCAAGIQPWVRFSELWTDWWLGDSLGAIVIAPVILTIARRPQRWKRAELIEASLLLAGTVLTTQWVFTAVPNPGGLGNPLAFVVFPFVVAAAVRLQPAATTTIVMAISAVTVWHTVRGAGPFATLEVHHSLMLLQTFMGVVAGTGLLLGGAIAERRTSEQRRAAAHAVGEALGKAVDLDEAGPEVLRHICTELGWPCGGLWIVNHDLDRLTCLALWVEPRPSADVFVQVSRQSQFPKGKGLPGRVWSSGQPAWVEDVVRDANFPRAAAARAAGFHGAFAFPIRFGDEFIGVVECFNRTVLPLDRSLLQTMATVGNQIGQFAARKRVEAVAAGQERRTRAILDTAIDAVIGMDHQGTVTDFNPAAELMFGHAAGDAMGRELADLIIPPALRDRHRNGLRTYLATGHGPFVDRRIETTARHANGTEFPVEISITRLPGEDPPRFTGFVRDLTGRLAADREREQLLARELKARREAETANRAKDEFLATLSHELRTPLNAIVGWTRMLLDGSLDEATARKALQVIDRNAQLQTQLVADILDVSRIISGRLQLNLQAVDLAAVINAAIDAVRPAASAKDVQIRLRISAVPRAFEGDPNRLQQVVWNLVNNAVKFSTAGSHVSITLADGDTGTVRIQVSDDGTGIDPLLLPHVFERFWQADGSTSRRHGGLGLGLAIVRHLVELHGGTVRAESEGPGRGSRFTVELPASDRSAAAGALQQPGAVDPELSGPAPSLAGCRVLVVDDEPDSREAVAAALLTSGATVATASSAGEALRLLDSSPVDVLLTDLGMPDVDGFDLIAEVRRRDAATGTHLPAAAVTAYADVRDRKRALAAGFDAFLTKPVTPRTILETVMTLRQGA